MAAVRSIRRAIMSGKEATEPGARLGDGAHTISRLLDRCHRSCGRYRFAFFRLHAGRARPSSRCRGINGSDINGRGRDRIAGSDPDGAALAIAAGSTVESLGCCSTVADGHAGEGPSGDRPDQSYEHTNQYAISGAGLPTHRRIGIDANVGASAFDGDRGRERVERYRSDAHHANHLQLRRRHHRHDPSRRNGDPHVRRSWHVYGGGGRHRRRPSVIDRHCRRDG